MNGSEEKKKIKEELLGFRAQALCIKTNVQILKELWNLQGCFKEKNVGAFYQTSQENCIFRIVLETYKMLYDQSSKNRINEMANSALNKMMEMEEFKDRQQEFRDNGGAIENWVNEWLIQNEVEFDYNAITQSKPDLYLNPDNHNEGLLEVKAFNRKVGPAFDLADFVGFAFELISRPYLLDLDCLVFGYEMNEETGDITVREVWLKKIWELAATSGEWPLKVQGTEDKSIIKKVRPGTWYSTRAKFKCFESKLDFLSAYEQTLYDYQATRARAANWQFQLKQSYRNYYHEELVIPRWDDIKNRYM